jgi:hypothetical protein
VTTVKNAEWELTKQQNREETAFRKLHGRGVGVTIAEVRKKTRCECPHSPKKHRKGGGCKGACPCRAGVR